MTLRRAALPLLFSLPIAVLTAQQLPRKAPEFVVGMPGGHQILLSQYRGKPVVLAVILTTCSHCQHTVGLLTKLQGEFASRGLQVVACAVQESPELAVPGFVKTFNPTFPVGFNADGPVVLDFFQYSRAKLPHMPILAFIDRQGMIRAQHEGGEEAFFGPQQEENLRREIEVIVKESASAKKSAKKR